MKFLSIIGLVLIMADYLLKPAFAAYSDSEVPVKAFARLPFVSQPQLSPDGSQIAVLLDNEMGYYDIAVTEYGTGNFRSVARMQSPRTRIYSIDWVNDDYLLVRTGFPVDRGGYTIFIGRLYSVNVDSGDVLELKPLNFRTEDEERYSQNANVVSLLKSNPEHVLVQWKTRNDAYSSVYKVDITDGTYEKLFRNEAGVDRWYANSSDKVTLGIKYDEEDSTLVTFYTRNPKSGEWTAVKSGESNKGEVFEPVTVENDDRSLIVRSDHEGDTLGLYRYDVIENKFTDTLFSVEGHDVDGAISEDGEVIGAYWHEDYREEVYFGGKRAELAALVKNSFRGAEVSIVSTSDDYQRLIVNAVRDNFPPTFFLVDLENGKSMRWFSQYPELAGVKLAEVRPISFEARDGLKLTGYLTLPVEGEGKPSLVVLVHGGPWARDYRTFNFWTQFLANRGYAVLQVNFRGSEGFGQRLERKGDKEWGRKMHQDVLDAVDWIKSQDIVDTDRQCITGGSYGGYEALVAATMTPGVFDCHISVSGISDLHAYVEKKGRFYGYESFFAERIGDPEDEAEAAMLKARSPLNHLARVEDPVLLLHGTNDGLVTFNQSANFATHARLKGKPVKYVEYSEATHFMDDAETRLKMFQEMEKFLEENLK